MKSLYERYEEMGINGGPICLEREENVTPYFCYPENAKAIGFEECIMYCFIEGYDEMVFAANPESCADIFVYPLAKNFEDFLGLILACGSVNPVEQIIWMDREQFEQDLLEEYASQTEKQKDILRRIEKELGVSAMEDPYGYVKELQSNFDSSGIKYSDEYYEVLGIE